MILKSQIGFRSLVLVICHIPRIQDFVYVQIICAKMNVHICHAICHNWSFSKAITPQIINYTYQPSPFNIHILPPPRSHPNVNGRRVANCPDILACFDTSPAAAWRKVHSPGRGSAPAPADPRAPWMGEAFASGGVYPNGFRNGRCTFDDDGMKQLLWSYVRLLLLYDKWKW